MARAAAGKVDVGEGLEARPVRLEAIHPQRGFQELAEQGVLGVIGPLVTDNSIALAPTIERLEVPAVTWTGTERYFGEFCFNLGNGGLGEETAIMANWIHRHGYRRIGMIHELSPGGSEYASHFRYYAQRYGLDIVAEAYTAQTPEDFEAVVARVREAAPECLA